MKLLAALLLLASCAFATTPAFVQKATGVNAAAAITVVSGSLTTSAGNALIVVIAADVNTNPQPQSCSGQGATFVLAGTPVFTTTGANGSLYLFYAKNIPGAVGAVTCTTGSGTGTWMSILVMEYSGLDTTAPLDASSYVGTNTSTSGVVSCGSITPLWDSELIIGGFATGSTVSAPTVGSGFTARTGVANGTAVRNDAEELIIAKTFTPQIATWNLGVAEDYRCGTFGFKAAGANLYVAPRRTAAVTAQ